MSGAGRVARSVFWLAWSRIGGQALSLLATLLVARMLLPADYGLIALGGIVTGVLTMLSEMGVGAAIVQFQDLDEDELASCFWLTVGLAAIGYAALYVAAPAIARLFATPPLADVLRVMGVALLLVAVRVVPDSLLRKRIALDRVAQGELLATAVAAPTALVLAWHGAGVWALVASLLVASTVQTIASFHFARWRPRLRFGGARVRALAGFSVSTLGSRVCWAAYQQADALVLGKIAGDAAVGIYAMARQLATLPMAKVTGVMNQLATPLMAERQLDRAALAASLARSLRLVVTVALPASVGLALVAEDFVHVVLTERWASIVPIVRLLSVYAIFSSVAVLFTPALMARYRTGFVLRYTAVQLVVMPPLFVVGALWGGGEGVALAWAVGYPAGVAWLARETLREVGLGWRTVAGSLRGAAMATAIMTAAVLGVAALPPVAETGPLLRLVATVAAGGAAYALALWRLDGGVSADVSRIAGWLVRGARARAGA